MGNEGKLHQAVINILTNAIQSIENKGSIVIRTRIINEMLELSVFDSGVGIDPQHLSHIFDAFYTTKEPGIGTGLGLTITYDIIEEFNGTIEIQSEIGEGTSVTVKLPLII